MFDRMGLIISVNITLFVKLPKPTDLGVEKRERDEVLAERLQKKLADPKSPSNSPMVKKLKVI